ncbi:hypothetical protein [Streptomyces sp. NPDC015131]|uniref:hypothetical protein n=1 Tax=Streptomyces sp. NPDC015131 TaxID=3364941 RepID=UPI0036FF6770
MTDSDPTKRISMHTANEEKGVRVSFYEPTTMRRLLSFVAKPETIYLMAQQLTMSGIRYEEQEKS